MLLLVVWRVRQRGAAGPGQIGAGAGGGGGAAVPVPLSLSVPEPPRGGARRSRACAAAAAAMEVQVAPLRAWDDFFPGSDRFALPDLKDISKWNNRVVSNLLYYQTNYLMVAAALVSIVGSVAASRCGRAGPGPAGAVTPVPVPFPVLVPAGGSATRKGPGRDGRAQGRRCCLFPSSFLLFPFPLFSPYPLPPFRHSLHLWCRLKMQRPGFHPSLAGGLGSSRVCDAVMMGCERSEHSLFAVSPCHGLVPQRCARGEAADPHLARAVMLGVRDGAGNGAASCAAIRASS